LSIWVWVLCKSLANFELDDLKYKQKFLNFGYRFDHKFKKLEKKIKIDTQIHTQKLKTFVCILNYLIRNLQKICKIPKPKAKTQILKKLKTQTQT
jgi:hypothetical protein